MIFSSVTFLVFFVVVYTVYWRLPHRAQNLFLVGASLWFYGSWNPSLLWLIVFSATVDHACGRGLARGTAGRARRLLLGFSVVTNLGLLGYYKYAGFFVESAEAFLRSLGFEVSGPTLSIVLPVGISFYTFQSMSYTVDVYRRQVEPCRGFLDFLLYVSFFPQLVAGPIERARHFLPQVLVPRAPLNQVDHLVAIKLLAVGFFQKMVIADNLAPVVDEVFSRTGELDGLSLLVGMYAFALQIYCDFSGYSKIARGVARLLGFRLMQNFAQPYLSSNITVFWRRWHVSLSTWLRDYLYIPLGGNRGGELRTYANLMVTMLLGGLWHGASWNFVLWGGLHGIYLAGHKLWLTRRGGGTGPSFLGSALGGLLTFHLVCLAWVFFRAETLGDALGFLTGLTRGPWLVSTEAVLVVGFALLSGALDLVLARSGSRAPTRLAFRHWVPETLLVTALVLAALLVGENDVVPFVYFQF